MTLRYARYAFGALSAAALVVLVIVDFFLVRNCGDAEGRDAYFLGLYATPVLAVFSVASFKDKVGSTSAWIVCLLVAPFSAWFVVIIAGLTGESAGICGRF